jgi:UDP-N-acetylmuramoylalanine--D-glutamate ligase
VKSILTLGEDAKIIEMQLGGLTPLYPCGNLQNVVAKARELAKSGDVVLLSPACASYDQFKNFEDRGDQFKALVGSLQ